MLIRLANVIYWLCNLIMAGLLILSIFFLFKDAFGAVLCIGLAAIIYGIGWSVKYVITGKKELLIRPSVTGTGSFISNLQVPNKLISLKTWLMARKTAFGILTIALIIVFYTSQSYYTEKDTGFAYELGYMLGASLGIYLVSLLIKKVAPKTASTTFHVFAALFLIFTIYHSYGLLSQKQAALNLAKSVADAAQKDLADALTKGETHSHPVTGNFGEFTPLMEIVNDSRAEGNQLFEDWSNQVNQFGDGVLTKEGLSDPNKIKANKNALLLTAAKAEAFPSRYSMIFNRVEQRLSESKIDPEIRDGALKGMKEARVVKEKLYSEFMKNEAKILYKLVEILDFYEHCQGKFEIKDDGPLFENNEDLNTFNKHSLELKDLILIENQLSQKMVSNEMEFVQKMKKYSE